MLPPQLELTLHAAATWFMVGVIWLIQLVHYPMFAFLDRAKFKRSHAFHSKVTTCIVMPAMLLELALSAVLVWRDGLANWPAPAGFALVALLWALTFFVMVPLHRRLEAEGFDSEVHATLLRWNWMRTFAWSARGIIAAFWF